MRKDYKAKIEFILRYRQLFDDSEHDEYRTRKPWLYGYGPRITDYATEELGYKRTSRSSIYKSLMNLYRREKYKALLSTTNHQPTTK